MRTKAIAIAGVGFLLGACSGISVTTDYDPTVDFTSYATYTWMDTEGDDIDNITDSRIRNSVEAGLAAKGLSKVTSNPDVAIGYQVTTAERRSYNTVNAGWGGGYGYGGYGWGGYGMNMGTSTTYENVWQEGTLLVGMFDAGTQNLVWTGTATTDLDGSRSPQERQEIVDQAVTKMLKNYPPGS